MSKYIMHNGTFREVTDEELMHWKYIKKEKKNGKWVYIYDESELQRAKKDAEKAQKKADRTASRYETTKIGTKATADAYAKADYEFKKKYGSATLLDMLNAAITKTKKDDGLVDAWNKRARAGQATDSAEKTETRAKASAHAAAKKAKEATEKYEKMKVKTFGKTLMG